MGMKLELVPLPVSDVDQSLAFYTEKVGFNLDPDGNSWALQQIRK
jgi:catechol 2,3-dioxygenase-like lactoylglutathione lyase family enzyme